MYVSYFGPFFFTSACALNHGVIKFCFKEKRLSKLLLNANQNKSQTKRHILIKWRLLGKFIYGLRMIFIRLLVSTILLTFCHCNGRDYDFSQTKEEVFGNGKMIKQRLVSFYVKGKQEGNLWKSEKYFSRLIMDSQNTLVPHLKISWFCLKLKRK